MNVIASAFDAVVLAAGRGSRLTELTNHTPKCLLPIGNIPLLWFPLRALERAGFTSAIVVYSSRHMTAHWLAQLKSIPERFPLAIKVRFVAVTTEGAGVHSDCSDSERQAESDSGSECDGEDWGTADTLRQIYERGLITKSRDLLLVSCDLVTAECDELLRLMAQHLAADATLSTLLADNTLCNLSTITAPGPKSKYKPERDVIVTSDQSETTNVLIGQPSLLCRLSSDADFEEDIPVPSASLMSAPRQIWRLDLLDTHVYCLAGWVLEYLCRQVSLTSVKGELVPRLVAAQFSRSLRSVPPDVANDSGGERKLASPVPKSDAPQTNNGAKRRVSHYQTMAECIPQCTHSQLVEHLSEHALYDRCENPSRVICYASTSPDPLTIRVNTLRAYLAINRQAAQLIATLARPTDAPQLSRIDPTAQLPSSKITIDENSVIGGDSHLSERSTITRSVIGRNCHVSSGVVIADSLLMDDVTVSVNCRLQNCILLAGCCIGDGAVLKDCIVDYKYTVPPSVNLTKQIVADADKGMCV